MYFGSSADGTFHTWRQRYPEGRIEQITSGPTQEEGHRDGPGWPFLHHLCGATTKRGLGARCKGRQAVVARGYSYGPKFTPDGKKSCYRIQKGVLPATLAFYPSELRVVKVDTGHNEPYYMA
jgi:hypothetical protein